jgi:transposase-like protein
MSTKLKKIVIKGKRYTPAEKQAVVEYVSQFNAQNGRGGQAAASKKFSVSVLTVSAWLKAAAPTKAAKATKAAPAPKPVKAPKATKAVKATQVVPQGTRYTLEQKKEVLAYVAAVNASKGRGGMSEAAKKFKITPLTISVWIRKFGEASGSAPAKGTKAKAAPAGPSPKVIARLQSQVAKTEAMLSKVKALLATL